MAGVSLIRASQARLDLTSSRSQGDLKQLVALFRRPRTKSFLWLPQWPLPEGPRLREIFSSPRGCKRKSTLKALIVSIIANRSCPNLAVKKPASYPLTKAHVLWPSLQTPTQPGSRCGTMTVTSLNVICARKREENDLWSLIPNPLLGLFPLGGCVNRPKWAKRVEAE
jgi:hypothetical protein